MPDYVIRQRDRGQAEANVWGRGWGRGQSFEAEAKSLRPRLRPKFWPRGHYGLEDLTSLEVGRMFHNQGPHTTKGRVASHIHRYVEGRSMDIAMLLGRRADTACVWVACYIVCHSLRLNINRSCINDDTTLKLTQSNSRSTTTVFERVYISIDSDALVSLSLTIFRFLAISTAGM